MGNLVAWIRSDDVGYWRTYDNTTGGWETWEVFVHGWLTAGLVMAIVATLIGVSAAATFSRRDLA